MAFCNFFKSLSVHLIYEVHVLATLATLTPLATQIHQLPVPLSHPSPKPARPKSAMLRSAMPKPVMLKIAMPKSAMPKPAMPPSPSSSQSP